MRALQQGFRILAELSVGEGQLARRESVGGATMEWRP
jgi:hypothetical protein